MVLRQDLTTLLHRRQFVLGPKFISGFSSWRRQVVHGGLHLTAHPEVAVAAATSGGAAVTLLGHALNPAQPESGLDEVAAELANSLSASGTLKRFYSRLDTLGGRWALVASLDGKTEILHDAAGLRQLCYTRQQSADGAATWCGSSTDLLALAVGLDVDSAVEEHIQSPDYKRKSEYWWPGDRTPFQGVRLLLPNHGLDAASGCAFRYWPRDDTAPDAAKAGSIELATAIETAADLLRGTLRAAAARFPLAISMTAGFDSRVTLAACRDVTDRLIPFSFVHDGITARDPDIYIPGRLLSTHGLEHQVFACPSKPPDDFEAAYLANSRFGPRPWIAVASGLHEHLPEGVVRVTSTVSEVARCFYDRQIAVHGDQIDGAWFGAVTQLGTTPFVCEAFDEWISGVPKNFAGSLLDLFYWEQRVGSWGGSLFRDWDLVQDGFSPFSSRALITTLLGVESSLRAPPDHPLHRGLIETLWPQLLEEPINPPPPRQWTRGLRRGARRALRRVAKRLR